MTSLNKVLNLTMEDLEKREELIAFVSAFDSNIALEDCTCNCRGDCGCDW